MGIRPPLPDATVIAVGLSSDVVHRYWSSVVKVGTLGTGPVPVDPHERGAPLWICRGLEVPWSTLWPALKHYDDCPRR